MSTVPADVEEVRGRVVAVVERKVGAGGVWLGTKVVDEGGMLVWNVLTDDRRGFGVTVEDFSVVFRVLEAVGLMVATGGGGWKNCRLSKGSSSEALTRPTRMLEARCLPNTNRSGSTPEQVIRHFEVFTLNHSMPDSSPTSLIDCQDTRDNGLVVDNSPRHFACRLNFDQMF